MKRFAMVCGVLVLLAGAAGTANPQEKPAGAQKEAGAMKASAIAQTPEWQQIKSLVGNWEGVVEMEGQKMTTLVEMRLTGDGSVVMHTMDKDTPHEMVTMFHPDGDRLLATHYCAAHNQPRMALVKGGAKNTLAFEFVDGTNIEPGDTRMQRLVLTIVDADHHEEAWTGLDGGKVGPAMVFKFSRKK